MNIGIIGAMDEEVELLIKEAKIEKRENKAGMIFNFGVLENKNVVIVRCGIGKVNAAICAQILADDFHVDYIINVGIAGGIGDNVYPGDIVIGNNLVEHDVDATAFGDKHGQIPNMDIFDFKCDELLIEKAKEACKEFTEHNVFVGRIVSGDQFIADPSKIRWLRDEFNGMACEMEGASIAHTAYLNKIPFIVIRSISDNANNGASMDYEKFKPIAIKNSTTILRNMINLL